MIRLAICGHDRSYMPAAMAGLRGAELAPLDACDAALVEPWPKGIDTAERCLLAGRHALVPAEACVTLAALDRLVAAAKLGGAQLAFLNAERFLPSRRLIKEQIDSGRLGEIGLVRIQRGQLDDFNEYEHQILSPMSRVDFDVVLWYFGRSPEVVFALGPEHGTYLQSHFGFAGGAMALLCSAYRPRMEDYRPLTVIGSRGAAYADHQLDQLDNYEKLHLEAYVTSENGRLASAWLMQHFIDGLTGQHDLAKTIQDWRQVLTLAEAVQQSLKTGQAVRLGGMPA